MKQDITNKIVEENRQTYNRIAKQFSSTRKYPWGEFSLFDPFLHDGARILDIGCGNGRLAEYFSKKKLDYTGIDNSERLIALAKEKNPGISFFIGNADKLPFPNERFDVVFLVATLHHIPSKKLRQQVLNEAYRVLRQGGHLIMTEWNLWSKQWWRLLISASIKKLIGKNDLDWGDIKKPWKNSHGAIQGYRYLHPFTKYELRRLLRTAGFGKINQHYTKKGQRASWYRGYNIFTSALKT